MNFDSMCNMIANTPGVFGVLGAWEFNLDTLQSQMVLEITKIKGGKACIFSLKWSKEQYLKSLDMSSIPADSFFVDDLEENGKYYFLTVERAKRMIDIVENLSVIAVDYLALLNDYNVLEFFKNISKTRSIPVLFTGHVSRGMGDYTIHRRPLLRDICRPFNEQIIALDLFDWIAMVHRDHECDRGIGTAHRYNISKETELIISKNRFGKKGKVFMRWDDEKKCYVDSEAKEALTVGICSRKEIEAMISNKFSNKSYFQNIAVISFHDPVGRGRRCAQDYVPIDFTGKCDRVMQIAIHDLDPEALSDFDLTVDTYFPEADALAEFIYKAKEDGLDIICQCEYGQSRSAGCAAAILQHFSKNGIAVFTDYRYYPNQLVYHKVFDALKKYRGGRI